MGFGHLAYSGSDDGAIAKWYAWLLCRIETDAAIELMEAHARSTNPAIAAAMKSRLEKMGRWRL